MKTPCKSETVPAVLILSGFDPTGSAGILADTRVIALTGCHACGIITCQTVQSSHGVTEIHSSDAALIKRQLDSLLDDIPFTAIKIGALSSVEVINTLAESLLKLIEIKRVPIVLDPIFKPTAGPEFLDFDCRRALSGKLMPQVLISTPNVSELGVPAQMEVDPGDDNFIGMMADAWLDLGLKYLLVTGMIRDDTAIDRLYWKSSDGEIESKDFTHPKHDVEEVHGTGCVLSSAIAGYLARGEEVEIAVGRAIEFTSEAISNAKKIGEGSLFWG